MEDILDIYETANITLASALMCHGCHVAHVKLTGRNGNMGLFCMSSVPRKLLDEFDQGRLLVDPTMFHVHLRRLTSMVKGVLNG